MKNKRMMGLTIVASLSLLALVAFAGTPGNRGYELFKDVLQSNVHENIENAHVTGTVEITDNGKSIARIEGSFDGDERSKEVSGDVRIVTDTLDKALSIYGTEEMMYIMDTKNNAVYMGKQSHTTNDEESDFNQHDFDGRGKDNNKSEAILDFLVGDMAQEFESIQDEDGTTDIKFELTKSEMPAIINLITSQESGSRQMTHEDDNWENEFNCEDYPLLKELKAADINFPELEEDIEVTYIAAVLDLDAQNEIKGLSFDITVTGLDQKGEFHSITIRSDFTFSELGSAQVKTMNTEGMTLYQLPEHTQYNNRD